MYNVFCKNGSYKIFVFHQKNIIKYNAVWAWVVFEGLKSFVGTPIYYEKGIFYGYNVKNALY